MLTPPAATSGARSPRNASTACAAVTPGLRSNSRKWCAWVPGRRCRTGAGRILRLTLHPNLGPTAVEVGDAIRSACSFRDASTSVSPLSPARRRSSLPPAVALSGPVSAATTVSPRRPRPTAPCARPRAARTQRRRQPGRVAAARRSGGEATRSPDSPRRRPSWPAKPGTDAVGEQDVDLAEIEPLAGGEPACRRLRTLERAVGVGAGDLDAEHVVPAAAVSAPVHPLWNSSANSGNVAKRNAVKPGREASALNSTAPPSAGNAKPSETPRLRVRVGRDHHPQAPPSPTSIPSIRWMPSAGRRRRCARRRKGFPGQRRPPARGWRRCPLGSAPRSPAR